MKKVEENTIRFNLMVSPAWLDALDQWRIHQPGIPNRSEALRRAFLIAAKGEKGKK